MKKKGRIDKVNNTIVFKCKNCAKDQKVTDLADQEVEPEMYVLMKMCPKCCRKKFNHRRIENKA